MVGTTEKTPEQIQALVNAGKNNQFGAEKANPQAQALGLKRNSIRNNIKYLSGQPYEEKDGKITIPLPEKPTVSQRLAAKELEKALNSDSEHMRRIEYLTEQVDGKLHQVNVNADLDKFEGMSEEELDDYNRKLDERIAAARGSGAQQPTGRDESGGAAAAQGNGGNSAGESAGAQQGSAGTISDEPIG